MEKMNLLTFEDGHSITEEEANKVVDEILEVLIKHETKYSEMIYFLDQVKNKAFDHLVMKGEKSDV
ncbi:hypothetical protein [Anaerotalea alkaliphila]|uniref:Uncharacterized protein n=1 Tax=Anaerotalea alkaliphila TaxID=2662126 RepID=A0A7X5HXI2_9FIRM|nr:hypothetical protein [Anaerotalea alkaliphila]NDL68487.1 hypothetical protein [Anaerotalea alkaliphila]